MVRFIGAVLIISACGACGVSAIRRLYTRVKSLEAVISSLNMMSGEICSRLTPMGDVLEILSVDAPEPASFLYKNALLGMEKLGQCSFNTIWREAVYKTKELNLKDEEAASLAELGACLGRYDVDEQARAIALTQRRMESFLRKAEEERTRDGRIHAFFSVAAGVFTVMILL